MCTCSFSRACIHADVQTRQVICVKVRANRRCLFKSNYSDCTILDGDDNNKIITLIKGPWNSQTSAFCTIFWGLSCTTQRRLSETRPCIWFTAYQPKGVWWTIKNFSEAHNAVTRVRPSPDLHIVPTDCNICFSTDGNIRHHPLHIVYK